MSERSRFNPFTIRTPEGITFAMPLSSPVPRFLAWLTDAACISLAVSLLATLNNLLAIVSRDLAASAAILSYFVISIGYGIVLEWLWRGQTLGKRLFGLRVLDEQGFRLRLSQVVIRNLLRFVDSLPAFYLVGGATALWTTRSQRLGDLVGGTVVVRTGRYRQPDFDQLRPGKYNSLREAPHLAARLRQKTTAAHADIALRALLRRESLDPAARLELYRDIADSFRSLVELPASINFGLTDEQLLRNVVEILFQHPSTGGPERALEIVQAK